VLRRGLWQLIHSPRLLGERYTLLDTPPVTLYTDDPALFPGYQPSRPALLPASHQAVRVSLVITARNEAACAGRLFDSLLRQTRLPDKLILVDTGSQDNTLELLRAFAGRSPIPCQVIERPGANIAQGRNAAIAAAHGPVIAVTDFGCVLRPDWLERLVAPFAAEPETQVSAGRYVAVDRSGQPTDWLLGPKLAYITPETFLPAAVSVAFTKAAWQSAGGYPEWLTLTGEDTYFALELKRVTRRWAFVPEALVEWQAPQTAAETWRKAYRWSIGDGEAGTTARAYRWAALMVAFFPLAPLALAALGLLAVLSGVLLLKLAAAALALAWLALFVRYLARQGQGQRFILLFGAYLAQVWGFVVGLRRRPQVDRRRYATLHGVCLVLSGIPIDDTGGGARAAQIALELLRRQYLVVFVNKFPKYETVEQNLLIRHPNLVTLPLSRFRWADFVRDYLAPVQAGSGAPELLALVELPLAETLPLLDQVRAAGGKVIYDLLDDWQTDLGGSWYHPEAERSVIERSQLLLATAPRLAQRLEQMSGRPVTLLPNAVNSRLFDPRRACVTPADWPAADWHAIYVGALWGAWFDWELLKAVGRAYPQAAVVVIGDYARQCPDPPANLHFLGLKPQSSLPAYLAQAHVALIPWKVNEITQATSPLKVYEYIAMHKPIVAPAIQPLHGLPGVCAATDPADFVRLVGQAGPPDVATAAAMEAFTAANDWGARLDQLFKLLAALEPRP
jgi:hypothetical protein